MADVSAGLEGGIETGRGSLGEEAKLQVEKHRGGGRRHFIAIVGAAAAFAGVGALVFAPDALDSAVYVSPAPAKGEKFAPPELKHHASLLEGFEMLEQKRRAGLSPVHAKYKQMERYEEDVIYMASDDSQIPPASSDAFKITLAKCLISVDQAVFALASAALNAEAASRACENMSYQDRLSCGSDISGVVTNVGWMTSYLFYIPAFCGFQDIVASWCGGDWAWFFSNAGSLTSTALGAAVDCSNTNASFIQPVADRRLRAKPSQEHDGGEPEEEPADRWLGEEATDGAPKDEETTGRRMAADRSGRPHDAVNCGVTANSAAVLITNEVFNGWSTHKVCSSLSEDPSSEYKGLCAAGVIGLANFGLSATSIAAGLAGTCPKDGSNTAYCVGDVTGMASTVVSYGSWAGTINHDCADAFYPFA